MKMYLLVGVLKTCVEGSSIYYMAPTPPFGVELYTLMLRWVLWLKAVSLIDRLPGIILALFGLCPGLTTYIIKCKWLGSHLNLYFVYIYI
jgi:hypothetical protein